MLHNMGGLAHAAGRPADGEQAARRAVTIREANLGANHPDVAADRAALAAILDALGRHDEAAELLEGALAVFQRTLGPDHYEVGVTLANLGAIDARRGDLAPPSSACVEHWRSRSSALGKDHVELVPTLGTLGVVCRRAGDRDAARQHTERALRLLETRGLDGYPQATTLRANLARLDGTRLPSE